MQHSYFSRLCFLQKWHNYPGYGFSLQAIKGKVGHFISEVDERSPAYSSGLRDNDFVVEVNGINVLSEPHYEVVKRITEDENKVALLVLDQDSREYFEQNGIIVDGYMENLKKIVCPPYDPYSSKELAENNTEKIAVVQPTMSNGNRLLDENNCFAIPLTTTTKASLVSSVTQKPSPSISVTQSQKPIQTIQPVMRNNQETVPSSWIETKQTIQPAMKINHSSNNSERSPSPKLIKKPQIKIIREYENIDDSGTEKQKQNHVNHNNLKNDQILNQKTKQKSDDIKNIEKNVKSLSLEVENNSQQSNQYVNNIITTTTTSNNNINNNNNEDKLLNKGENHDRQTLNRQQRRDQMKLQNNFAERAKIFNEL